MSSKREKRRQRTAPMPATGAGLLRFFEEDAPGLRVKPGIVVVFALALIAVAVIAQIPFLLR